MCGRFTYLFTWPEIHAHLSAFLDLPQVPVEDVISAMPARYNIAPTQPILGVALTDFGIGAHLYRWGLMPSWIKDPTDFPLLINARIESVIDKPAFRGSMRHMRCLIPASGFYEWKKLPDGTKQPYYITMADGAPMVFAGLWSTWTGPEGEEVDTAAIVTQAATAELKPLHDRTPVVLRPEQYAHWLDSRHVDPKDAVAVIEPLAVLGVRTAPVARRVGSIRNDDPGLIEPVAGDEPGAPDKAVAAPAAKRKKTAGGGQQDLF